VTLAATAPALLFAQALHAARGDCGQPVTAGPTPSASDCLSILYAAVGTAACDPICICDVDGSSGIPNATDALTCLRVATGVPDLLRCDCGRACPDTLDIAMFARIGRACDDDTDCTVGACDLAISRCVTAGDFDFGWTGLGHDIDTNDMERLLARLSCGEATPCGVCTIDGVDPASRACRCVNDNRTVCDQPFVADQDDCAGDTCACYLGPPVPLSAGNTPACIVHRLAADLGGLVDVDTGDLAVTLQLRAIYHTGEEVLRPCPYCEGDLVAADGVRDGTCALGPNEGQACDVDATSASFPAPGGAGYSLDCFPAVGKNKSGAGLVEKFTLASHATSLTATVDCNPFGEPTLCHCGVCSENASLACRSDADCSPDAAGTCMPRGSFDPKPNGCAGAGGCTATGDGDASCDEGPIDHYCDGILQADGSGILACASNADCDAGIVGVEGGSCSLSTARECFLPTIVAEGTADPDVPVAAAVFCVPPTAGAGTNATWGLPGPARLVRQITTRKLCGGPSGTAYGTNEGCPRPLPVAD
jgi:hypothetical protein